MFHSVSVCLSLCCIIYTTQQGVSNKDSSSFLRGKLNTLKCLLFFLQGDNVSIKCMSPNDQRHEKFGYNWTKNKVLLRMVPGVEVWEDLHPAGSILKIFNAQVGTDNVYIVHVLSLIFKADLCSSDDLMMGSGIHRFLFMCKIYIHLYFLLQWPGHCWSKL